jgi:hypothetical protein
MTYGFAGHIGLARETTWGTAVAATDYIEAYSEDISTTIDRFATRNIFSGYYEPDDSPGVHHHEGSISAPGFPHALGYFLTGVCGQSSTATVSGSFYTATFEPRQSDVSSTNPLNPFTFEVFRDVTSAQQYDGAQISALSMSIAPNQDLRMSASIMAKATRNIAATTASYPTAPTQPFIFTTASLSIGGVAEALVENLTINIDNQLEGVPALNNDDDISRIRRTGAPTVGVSGTVDFLNINKYQDFVNQTEVAMVLDFTVANSYFLTLDMPRVVYTAFPLGMSGAERLTVSFEGKARYSVTSATAIRATLTSQNSF